MILRSFLRMVAFGVVLAAIIEASANAGTRERRIASYCSPSGDVCFGIFARNREVLLRISTAAHYFSRYMLCVRGSASGASGLLRCGSFPVFRQCGSTWGSTVRYGRQYPGTEPGVYRVTWKLNAKPLGPTLRFRLPLRRH